jgi:predicted nucleic acid-binding protein
MTKVLEHDPAIVTWWGTPVECVSAIARLERDRDLDVAGVRDALARLRAAAESWTEVPAMPVVCEQAIRLLRTHPLRAADAVQLGAAIVAADFEPASLQFVTLDARQEAAAEREGFARVISP